ncbi:hypothetical protein [Taibaiella soli]|uniref:Uncharacterized protein n=1 Tax=Taibaiella soli TaxID=1649169 RepID=A0A2W2B5W4_9BACT|nr:hypothetical protein [Taibaiella soli]PZF71599.1 hypothetical protein DN068_16115 [Taibaiella soli]
MEKEEDKKRLLPIEKYKHFKGIYLERTKEYYLCDFYEIRMPDDSVLYRVLMDLSGNDHIAELHCIEGSSWKFIGVPDTLPTELEAILSDCIINYCLKK